MLISAALAAGPAHAVMNGLGQDLFPAAAIFQSSVTLYYQNGENFGLTVSSGLVINSGYVGFGLAAPQAALHVVGGGAGYGSAFIVDTDAKNGGTIILGNDATNGDQVRVGVNGYLRSQSGRFGMDSTGNPITFEISESEKMRVAAGGNVGIGTNDPSYPLSVYRGAAASTVNSESGANGSAVQVRYAGKTDGAAAQVWGAGMNITDGTAGFEIYDYTDGASRLYIDTAGEIGIGNTNPSYKLDVTGTFRVVNNASMLESANTWGTEMHVYNTSAGGRNWAMVAGGSANSDPGNFYVSNQGTAVMTFSSTNKVGVNKSAAESSLQIGAPVDATLDYTQLDTLNADTAGPPAAGDCNAAAEVGRMIVATRYSAAAEYRLWICTQDGAASFTWKYATLN